MSLRHEILTSPSPGLTPAETTAQANAILAGFCPPVSAWWTRRFGGFTAPQLLAIPSIAAGQHTLVCAPTGSGKSLCAFISVLSDLYARQLAGTLQDAIDTVYISPLKALGADVERNLL
ncbi:MAG: DEAD/DEAH box helicase, partial [Phycisphaerae bacterium]